MYTRRINVRGIIYKDGQLFVQRLKNSRGEARAYWSTPGGGLDDGEDILAGLRREMIEETGVAPVIGKLLFVEQFHDGEKEQLEFFFHITNTADYEELNLITTSHGMIEVAECGFQDPQQVTILPTTIAGMDLDTLIHQPSIVTFTSELPTLITSSEVNVDGNTSEN